MTNPLVESLSTEGVLRLTMNRPEVRNAFDDRQVERLISALEIAAHNAEVRVVVLASEGRSFCAGGDIEYMRRIGESTFQENLEDAKRLARLMKLLNCLPKPTIARVQGAAMGGGVGLVACCDFAIGCPKAYFATSEVRLGMVAATIAPYVVATIGEKPARRMFTSGLSVPAERAVCNRNAG